MTSQTTSHKAFWNRIFCWSAVLACVITFAALVFRLDFTALQSYDEAWYGAIARNLVQTKNPLKLEFNSGIFTDHPPGGFILMAIPTAFLGSTEFSVRLTSVVLATATIGLLIGIGRQLKLPVSGFGAAAILMSCLWFLLRARSGNLDVPFIFWETLTVFFLLRLPQNPRNLVWAAASFAGLFLTKTLIGGALLPLFFISLIPERKHLTRSLILQAILLVLLIILPWYVVQTMRDPQFLTHHFVEIGARGGENTLTLEGIIKNLLYIRSGIGKWYYVFGGSVVLALIGLWKFAQTRWNFFFLLTWTASFGVPFFLSSHSEVWHFLPVYPAAAMLVAFTLAQWNRWGTATFLPTLRWSQHLWLVPVLFIAVWQFRNIAPLLYLAEPETSWERDISQRAQPYKQISLMDTFYPALVYYSDSTVDYMYIRKGSFELMLEGLETNPTQVFLVKREVVQELSDKQVSFAVLDENQKYALIRGLDEK